MLNHNLWFNGSIISIDILAKLRHTDQNQEHWFFDYISEDLINPTDKMAMKPVLQLFDPQFTDRLIAFSAINSSNIPVEQQAQFTLQIQSLGKYLQQVYHIYNVFIQSTQQFSIESKLEQINETIKFFQHWHKQV